MANEATNYGVRIVSAPAQAGEKCWRAVRVWHYAPEENDGRHHIFVDCLDEEGERAYGVKLRTGWQSGEDMAIVDKPFPEPGTNIPMWRGQVRWVEVADGIISDRVENIHTEHPDEGGGNTRYHHSFGITFQRIVQGGIPLPPSLPDKFIEHYILFGPKGMPGQHTNLIIAQEYILRCGATCGFSTDEAMNAQRVTIVAGTGMVSEDEERRLKGAGCEVLRIRGDSYAVERAFAGLPCYKENWGD